MNRTLQPVGRASTALMDSTFGALPVIGDAGQAIAEIREMVKTLRPRIEGALDAVPRIEGNVDTITTYTPWLIGALGFVGVAIIINAVVTHRSKKR